MLTFSARQSEDRLTRGALTVDVSFSISEFVFLKTPEITELFVLTTALCDIFRKHTEADNDNERHRQGVRRQIYPQSIERGVRDVQYEGYDRMRNNNCKISYKHNVAELIRAVPPVHQAVQPSLKFSHKINLSIKSLCTERFYRILLSRNSRREESCDKGKHHTYKYKQYCTNRRKHSVYGTDIRNKMNNYIYRYAKKSC